MCDRLLKTFKAKVEEATLERAVQVDDRNQAGPVTKFPGVNVTLKRLPSRNTGGSAGSLRPYTPGNPKSAPGPWLDRINREIPRSSHDTTRQPVEGLQA